MRKLMNILVLGTLLACLVPANAQDFTQPRDPAIQSQQIISTGNAYNGTVYEPFNNTTPAEYNSVSVTAPANNAPSGPRRSLIGGPEDPSGPSPIGDAVLPLLLMSLAFAGVIYFRKRHARA